MDRFKHYLSGREFTIAADHKAQTSALGENCSNKTYQSRLTKWVDRLLPYQFKIMHIPGKDMDLVDKLSREPNGEPSPESELDEKFVVTSIENFHRALYSLNNQLLDMAEPVRNEYILEHSGRNTGSDNKVNTSSHGCYSNQICSKRTRLERNENGRNSRISNSKTNTLCNFSHSNQLAKKLYQNSVKNLTMENNGNAKNDKDKVEKDKSGKKKVRDIRQGGGHDQVTEEVMKTTFQQTRLIKRGPGATNEDTDSSDSEIPYAEWRIMRQQIKNKDAAGTSTSANLMCKEGAPSPAACSEMAVDKKERPKLVSFCWDLVGLEGSEKPKRCWNWRHRRKRSALTRSIIALMRMKECR